MSFSPKLKAVVFDLDGTLLDTAPEFIEVVHQLRDEHDLPRLPEPLIRANVSNGARALVQLSLGLALDHPEFETKRQRLLTIYSGLLGSATLIYPGIEALLTELHAQGIRWGISTNKPAAYAEPLLESINLQPACGSLVCPDHVSQPKPHPEPLFLNCEQLGCASEEVIYIGDHRRDIDAGRAAGMVTIAAAYGYIEQDDDPADWGADILAEDSRDLSAALKTLLH